MTISGARPRDESEAFALWTPVIRQHESQVNNGIPGMFVKPSPDQVYIPYL